MRTEFGEARSICACRECIKKCLHMPGFLIPADLDRLIPPDTNPFVWAESNLLASPGAVVIYRGQLLRIPTLVPAVKPDGSCIHLVGGKRNGRCSIHENAPFGCAFFSCNSGRESDRLASNGLVAICNGGEESLYVRLLRHLNVLGKRQLAPEILRKRIAEAS